MKLNVFDSAGIRRYAASVVRRNRTKALLAVLLATGIDLAVQIVLGLMGVTDSADQSPVVSLLANLVILLVSAPLTYGLYELFLRMVHGQNGSVSDIFQWYADGTKLKASVWGQLWFTLLGFCWLMLYVFPAAMVGGFFFSYTGGFLLMYLIILVAMIFGVAEFIMYIPGAFMLAEDPERSVTECFSAARQAMKPYRWQFFGFYMLYILQVIAIIIPFIVVMVLVPMSALLSSLLSLIAAAVACLVVMPRLHMGCICYYHAVFDLEVAHPDEPCEPFTM